MDENRRMEYKEIISELKENRLLKHTKPEGKFETRFKNTQYLLTINGIVHNYTESFLLDTILVEQRNGGYRITLGISAEKGWKYYEYIIKTDTIYDIHLDEVRTWK